MRMRRLQKYISSTVRCRLSKPSDIYVIISIWHLRFSSFHLKLQLKKKQKNNSLTQQSDDIGFGFMFDISSAAGRSSGLPRAYPLEGVVVSLDATSRATRDVRVSQLRAPDKSPLQWCVRTSLQWKIFHWTPNEKSYSHSGWKCRQPQDRKRK